MASSGDVLCVDCAVLWHAGQQITSVITVWLAAGGDGKEERCGRRLGSLSTEGSKMWGLKTQITVTGAFVKMYYVCQLSLRKVECSYFAVMYCILNPKTWFSALAMFLCKISEVY